MNILLRNEDAGEPEIHETDAVFGTDHNIAGFHIPVKNPFDMSGF